MVIWCTLTYFTSCNTLSFTVYRKQSVSVIINLLCVDVVGIVENHESVVLREILTRQQRKQFQTKFKLTDGRFSFLFFCILYASYLWMIIYILLKGVISFHFLLKTQLKCSCHFLGCYGTKISKRTILTTWRSSDCNSNKLPMWNLEQ